MQYFIEAKSFEQFKEYEALAIKVGYEYEFGLPSSYENIYKGLINGCPGVLYLKDGKKLNYGMVEGVVRKYRKQPGVWQELTQLQFELRMSTEYHFRSDDQKDYGKMIPFGVVEC